MRKNLYFLVVLVIFIGYSFIPSARSENIAHDQEVIAPPLFYYQPCPVYPGPRNFTQPNNYTFLVAGCGDEFGVMFFLIALTSTGYWINRHPISRIDGWWYLCYWNETKSHIIWEVPSSPDAPRPPGIYWAPLLISTGVKIGDTLPHKPFTLTQLNGDTFKAKLKGTIENPHWETTSGKLIIQVPTPIDGVVKGVWYYAEYTDENALRSTEIPVNEHESQSDNLENDPASIPGFSLITLILILCLIIVIFKRLKFTASIHSNRV